MKEKIGASFTKSFKIAGLLAIAVGILTIILGVSYFFIFGIILIVLGVIVNTAYYGIEINKNTHKFREFTNILGLTFGQFNNISDYVYVSTIQAQHGYKIYGSSNISTSVSEKKYDVCLFDKTFRKKAIMKICDTVNEASEFANKISQETGLELSKYNPPISDSTLNRRTKKNK